MGLAKRKDDSDWVSAPRYMRHTRKIVAPPREVAAGDAPLSLLERADAAIWQHAGFVSVAAWVILAASLVLLVLGLSGTPTEEL